MLDYKNHSSDDNYDVSVIYYTFVNVGVIVQLQIYSSI